MKYEIIAEVRKRGAIGQFYPAPHVVTADSPEQAKDQWFTDYGNEWELNRFIRITPEP